MGPKCLAATKLVDSAASVFLTASALWLNDVQPMPQGSFTISQADGAPLIVTAVGRHPTLPVDVYVAPNLGPYDLYSFGALEQAGCIYTVDPKDPGMRHFLDAKGITVLSARLDPSSNLYVVESDGTADHPFKLAARALKLWGSVVRPKVADLVLLLHQALGHISMEGLILVVNKGLIANLPKELTAKVIRDHFPDTCIACIRGKAVTIAPVNSHRRQPQAATSNEGEKKREHDQRPTAPGEGSPTVQQGEPTVQQGEPAVQQGEPAVQQGEPAVQQGEPALQHDEELVVGIAMPATLSRQREVLSVDLLDWAGEDTTKRSFNGCRWMLVVRSLLTKFLHIVCLRSKAEAVAGLAKVLDDYHRRKRVVAALKADNEFGSDDVRDLLAQHGILPEFCPPEEHFANGYAEEAVQLVQRSVRTVLHGSAAQYPQNRWPAASNFVAMALNVSTSTTSDSSVSAYEAFHGVKPDFARTPYLPFGRAVEGLLDVQQIDKPDSRTFEGFNEGFSDVHKHVIKVFNVSTDKTVLRRSFWMPTQPRGYDRLVDMSDEGVVQEIEAATATHLQASRKQRNKDRRAERSRIKKAAAEEARALKRQQQLTEAAQAKAAKQQAKDQLAKEQHELWQRNVRLVAERKAAEDQRKKEEHEKLVAAKQREAALQKEKRERAAAAKKSKAALQEAKKVTKDNARARQQGYANVDVDTPASGATPGEGSPTEPGVRTRTGRLSKVNKFLSLFAGNGYLGPKMGRAPLSLAALLDGLSLTSTEQSLVVNAYHSPDPRGYKSMLKHPAAHHFKQAADNEVKQLLELNSWEAVPGGKSAVPRGAKILNSMFVWKTKYDQQGVLTKYKARLTVRGDEADDVGETYSPCVHAETVKLFFALGAALDWDIGNLDITAAFVQEHLPDGMDVYMRLPSDHYDGQEQIVRLKKSLYGLCEAPRIFQRGLAHHLLSSGYTASSFDPCLFYKTREDGTRIYALTHVDDILILAPRPKSSEVRSGFDDFKAMLETKYQVTGTPEVSSFLGYLVKRDRARNSLTLSQPAYARHIVEQAGLGDKPIADSPGDPVPFTGTSQGPGDASRLRKLVGLLQYLTLTRSDISCELNRVAKTMNSPTFEDVKAAERIVKYINGTLDHGVTFSGTDTQLYAWADASFESERGGFSRSSIVFSLGKNSGAFLSKSFTQLIRSLSTQESEIQALSEAARYVLYFRYILNELGIHQDPTVIYEDNNAAISFAKGESDFDRTKHIARHYRFIAQQYEFGELDVVRIDTADQRADQGTKILHPPDHLRFTAINLNLSQQCG